MLTSSRKRSVKAAMYVGPWREVLTRLVPGVQTCAVLFFFFTDSATTEIYTLSLPDALPISRRLCRTRPRGCRRGPDRLGGHHLSRGPSVGSARSEEHTSELQSQAYPVCRLLLEKNKSVSALAPWPTSLPHFSPAIAPRPPLPSSSPPPLRHSDN